MSTTRKILIACSALLLVYSLASLGGVYLQDYNEQQQIDALAHVWHQETNAAEGAASPPAFVDTPGHPDERAMLPPFRELRQQNSDIVGWLTIDGTRIDYPIMQSPDDPEFYLDHGFDRRGNKNGLPFLDERNSIDRSSLFLIHGHHMKSGAMFTDLMKYKEESYYKEHPMIRFSTLYEQADYEIMAVILSKVYRKTDDVFKYYQIEEVDTPEALESYIRNVEALALYETGVTAQPGDRLLILSTCEYSSDNGRLAVVARQRS